MSDTIYSARLSPAYVAALKAHDDAAATFNAVRQAYRAQQVGNAEFIAARLAFAKATEAFDEAYQLEVARLSAAPDPIPVGEASDSSWGEFQEAST